MSLRSLRRSQAWLRFSRFLTQRSVVGTAASARKKMRSPARSALFVEQLEQRVAPAYTATLVVGAVTFTGDAGSDVLTFSDDGSGRLMHNRSGDAGFASAIDLDTGTAGVQSIQISLINSLLAMGLGGNDTITIAFTNLVNVRLEGGDGNDSLTGGNGDDTLDGGNGADTLIGGSGNEQFFGGAGADSLNGNGGVNLLIESRNSNFTLSDTSLVISADAATDILAFVQEVSLTGGAGANLMDAATFTGNVTLLGGDGADTLRGGLGNDSLDGQGGVDRLEQTADVNFTLATNSLAGMGFDFLSNIEEASLAGGASDNIFGVSGWNTVATLNGAAGNDRVVKTADVSYALTNALLTGGGTFVLTSIEQAQLTGGGGANVFDASAFTGQTTLDGQGGNDTFIGGTTTDILVGGGGDDTYIFDVDTSRGSDTVVEGAGGGDDTFDFTLSLAGVTINLGTLGVAQAVHTPNLTLTLSTSISTNPQIENLIGGAGNDALTGNSLPNQIIGGGGNDTMAGSTGDDVYFYPTDATPQGSDRITEVAGEGTDLIELGAATLAITFDMGLTIAQVLNANLSLTLTNPEVEEVNTGSGADIVSGSNSANAIDTGDGNDTLAGRGGDDLLVGGNGDDVFVFDTDGALGNDTLADGAGVDLLDFSPTTQVAVAMDLGNGAAQVVNANLTLTSGGIENLRGGSQDDTLIGDNADNVLTGGPGNDTYFVNTGGDDTVAEAAGGGTDTIDFSASNANIIFNLGFTGAQAIAGMQLTLSSAEVENFFSGGGDDSIIGSAGGNSILGGSGNDTIEGMAGNDTMFGQTGDDVYLFDADTGLGSDFVVEFFGEGSDTLDYTFTALGVSVNIGVTVAQTVNANQSLTLIFTSIETVLGGSGNDTITGDFDGNSLIGNGGNDILNGSLGDDTIVGLGGNDTLDGGPGDDTFFYDADTALGSDTIAEPVGGGTDLIDFSATSSLGVSADLGITTAQVVNPNLTLTLTLTEIENAIGGDGNDSLTGSGGANSLIGGLGNDTLEGRAGNDTLEGNAGNDTYAFDADNALGTDTITENASEGTDALDFFRTTASVTVNLSTVGNQTINSNLTISLTNVEVENVRGGDGNDVLTGSAADNVIEGGPGNDTSSGADGDDTYIFDTDGAIGSDQVSESPNEGADLLDFSSSTLAVTVDLALAGNQTVNANLTLDIPNAEIENVSGGSGADSLMGNASANVITGNGGSDTLVGRDGDDTYVFDADTQLNSDTVTENANGGTDLLNWSGTTGFAVIFNLASTALQAANANHSLTLTATEVENITGGEKNDSLTGSTAGNVIIGGPGNDTMTGNAGNDTYGFDADVALGSDIVTETLALGGTADLLDFSLTTTLPATVNLTLTTAQAVNGNLTLTLTNTEVENVFGGSGNDNFTGTAANNSLVGGLGNDTLIGGTGDDTLVGESGDDSLTGGLGNDLYIFDTDLFIGTDTIVEAVGGGTDLIDLSSSTDNGHILNLGAFGTQTVNLNFALTLPLGLSEVENVVGGEQDDSLTGSALNNSIVGGDGDDILEGGAGNDTLIGNDDDDTYVFDADTALGSDVVTEAVDEGDDFLVFDATATQTVTVDLALTTAQVVNAFLTLVLTNSEIENITGGDQSDTLRGNAADNFIFGGPGSDILEGRAGDDTLDGIEGNDTYVFDTDTALGSDFVSEFDGEGTDLLDFSTTTTNTITVNLGTTNTQTVNANLDLTLSATEVENVLGGSLNDTLTGSANANVIIGGPGNDSMSGVAGNDTYVFDVDGALGADTVNEAANSGTDLLDFSSTTTVALTVNLGTTGNQTVHATNLTLNLVNAEVENVNGGDGADLLTGHTTANSIVGGAGSDTIIGLAGNDTMVGGTGNDAYLFDADSALGVDVLTEAAAGGTDLLDFSATTTQTIALSLASTGNQTVNSNLTLTLTATEVENIFGGALNDTLTGNSLNNSLAGGAGNDTYVMNGTGQGTDTINDSSGTADALDFSGFTAAGGVSINLTLAGGQTINTGDLTLTGANGIEIVTGSSDNDTLVGNNSDNTITGGPGNDQMTGGQGNDTYLFDADNNLGFDTLSESAGGGTDFVDFSSTTAQNVFVNLSTTGAQVVNAFLTLSLTAAEVENVAGGSGNDSLTGTAGANVLTGGPGNDTLTGGAGNDTYQFDNDVATGSDLVVELAAGGTDTLDFSPTSLVSITLNLGTTAVQVVNANQTLTLTNAEVENATGGALGDTLTGNANNNVLNGGDGNDSLVGLAGDDTLLGGNGSDTLDGGTGVDSLDGGAGINTIIDPDNPRIIISNVSQAEGNAGITNFNFTVSLVDPNNLVTPMLFALPVFVSFFTTDGTALAGADYTATAGTLTIPALIASGTITVPVLTDQVDELDESFFLNLQNPVNATLAATTVTATGTILNDDDPIISITDVTQNEGNPVGTTPFVFTVELSWVSLQNVTIAFTTANNTAVTPSDYTTTTGVLTILAGFTTGSITVPVITDQVDELNETFFINLSAPSNAVFGDNQAVGTILNDDDPLVSINDIAVNEPNAGTVNATFTVSLSWISIQDVVVSFNTSDGTATAGLDYTTTVGSVTVLAGQLNTTLNVPVIGETLHEIDETFFVNLLGSTNSTIADALGVGTILNDDFPTLSIADVVRNEGDTGTTAFQFTATLSFVSLQDITVAFTTAPGTATAGADYTTTTSAMTILAGSPTGTITIPVVGETLFERDETFFVNLSSPFHVTLGDTQALGTIVNDDHYGTTIATGDVNGDGFADLAIVEVKLNSVSVRLGNGFGGFGAPNFFAAGIKPTTVAAGDLDNDGDLDLVVANSKGNNIAVLLGNGNGTFQAAIFYTTGRNPSGLDLHDLNADGNLDISVANFKGQSVSVLLGIGDGAFGATANFNAGLRPAAVQAANFNNDAVVDLIVLNKKGSKVGVLGDNVHVLLGIGGGTFTSGPFGGPTTAPVAFGTADLNADGLADVIVADSKASNVAVLLKGVNSFGAPTTFSVGTNPIALAVADFNADGLADIAVANTGSADITVRFGNGTGGFGAATTYFTGNKAIAIAVDDFNGDSLPDIAVTDAAHTIAALLNNGAGGF